MFEAV